MLCFNINHIYCITQYILMQLFILCKSIYR